MMSDDLHNDPGDDSSVERNPVEQLAEDFLGRRRQGEGVSISEYAEKHPQLAQRIRDIFPTLLLMEELRPDTTSARSRSAAMTQASAKETLERLGDFRILREIGRGGMGIVYEAEQESLGRRVALKVLPAACLASATRLQRFLREAQAAARLHHTNIVPVFGVGQQDGIHYYVMQFIDGEGLDKVLHALAAGASSPQAIPCGQDAPPAPAQRCSGTFSATEAAQMLLAGPPTPDSQSSASASQEADDATVVAPGRRRPARATGEAWRGWGSRSPTPCSTPINKAPCTATSSRPTCSWTTAARCGSPISGWPSWATSMT